MTIEQITKVQFNPIFKDFNACRKRYRLAKGSAGSGKSVNIAQDFILKLSSGEYQGANLLVVRKIEESNRDSTFAELVAAIYRIFGAGQSVWIIRRNPIELECTLTGARIIFRGMKDDAQREKIKSITFPRGALTWIWIEEATELDEEDVDILDDRLRGRLENERLFYQITFSFNPIYASHWIKGKYFDIKSDDIFTHHSTYRDNRFIDEAYYRRMELRREQDPNGYRVYGLGEWGLVGGQFFSQWKKEIHVVKPFDIPPGWTKFRTMDWGSARPYAVLWGAVDYDGNLWIYRELYGYGGKPNVGTKESAAQVAEKIALLDGTDEINVAYLDSACWIVTNPGTPSIAEEINKVLQEKRRRVFIPSTKGRLQAAEQVKLRLIGHTNTEGEQIPGLRFFDTCFHSIRTIPILTHSKTRPEDVDTNEEDHAYDALGYLCLGRPFAPVRPKKSSWQETYKRERKESVWAV